MEFVDFFQDEVEPEIQYDLLAIVCPHPDTYMAWLLNRALNLDFVQSDNPVVPSVSQGQERWYASFEARDACLHDVYYHLIQNRAGGIPLIKQLKQVDYLLRITEGLTPQELLEVIACVKQVPRVALCMALDQSVKKLPMLAHWY